MQIKKSKVRAVACSIVLACCVNSTLAQAKTGAKEFLESYLKEKVSKKYAIQQYTCKGNESKASCVIPTIAVSPDITLKNIRIESSFEDTKISHVLSSNVAYSVKDDKYREMLPQEFVCKFDSTLVSVTLGSNLNCSVKTPIYSFAINSIIDTESSYFKGKTIHESLEYLDSFNEIFDNIDSQNTDGNYTSSQLEKLNKLDVSMNPKFYKISIESSEIGKYILAQQKKSDPNFTKEQYEAMIDMGVAASNLQATKVPNITPQTIEQITKVNEAIGSLMTSKSKKVEISLKRKNQTKLSIMDAVNFVSQITSNPQSILESLNNYDISVVKR